MHAPCPQCREYGGVGGARRGARALALLEGRVDRPDLTSTRPLPHARSTDHEGDDVTGYALYIYPHDMNKSLAD